jgi:hypothetical protein
MKQRNLIALSAAVTMVAFAVASAAEAATTVKGTRSNGSEKTPADCTKAGGKWGKGNEGVGCYMPEKPAAGSKTTPK